MKAANSQGAEAAALAGLTARLRAVPFHPHAKSG